MSPLWRDEVGIYVSPRQIVLTRMKRGIRPLNIAECSRPVINGGINQWEMALDTLAHCLEETTWHGANGRLIVADHWARYAIVPWSDSLTDQGERIQHARYCLARTYGDVVSQWTVTLNECAPGIAQVACAIPSALLARIHDLTEAHGPRVKSVQPQLTASFNSWRPRLPKGDGWFVTLEEESLAAAHFTTERLGPCSFGADRQRLGDGTQTAADFWTPGADQRDRWSGLRRCAQMAARRGPRMRATILNGSDDACTDASVPEGFALLQRLYA